MDVHHCPETLRSKSFFKKRTSHTLAILLLESIIRMELMMNDEANNVEINKSSLASGITTRRVTDRDVVSWFRDSRLLRVKVSVGNISHAEQKGGKRDSDHFVPLL